MFNFESTGEIIEIMWNPSKGTTQPFETVRNKWCFLVKYKCRNVVKMDGEYYQLIKTHFDFHPDLQNYASLLLLVNMSLPEPPS